MITANAIADVSSLPKVQSPGSSVMIAFQPPLQATPAATYLNDFSTLSSILSGTCMWIGAVLILTASALIIQDADYYYTAIGVVLVIGFSFWFVAAVANWLPSFGGFGKRSRSGYHIINFFGACLAWISFAMLIAGAACWLSPSAESRSAGFTVWIISSCIWITSVLTRDMGVHWDGMNTFKNYPIIPTNRPDNASMNALGLHLSSLWGNAIATDLYMITAMSFLIGSALFRVDSRQFQVAAAWLWLGGSIVTLFSAIAQCVARK
jgi:hypothetical protein